MSQALIIILAILVFILIAFCFALGIIPNDIDDLEEIIEDLTQQEDSMNLVVYLA